MSRLQLALNVPNIDEAVEFYSKLFATNDRVDTIMIRDPDGNSIAFSLPKDRTLAH
jgi:predicted enzyme related to lactoylglutathione lyase